VSVLFCREVIDGRGASQNFAENVKTKRTFIVTVDDPTTPLITIANTPGIRWLDKHPEFPTYCLGIDPENDGDPLHYKITFRYDLLRPEERHKLPWERADKFRYSGSLTSGPFVEHFNDGNDAPKPVINSAGDPIEGLEKEEADWIVSITGNRQEFDKAKARQYFNAVNSDTYSGCPAGTVKCQVMEASQEIEQVDGDEVTYWAITTSLAYRETGWDTKVWNVGFNEIVGGQRKAILDAAGNPVSTPVALAADGSRKAGTPPVTPDMLTFKKHKRRTFTGTFPALP
jgi:hypothetical protein